MGKEKYQKVIYVHQHLYPNNIITSSELTKHDHLIRNIQIDDAKRKYLKYKAKYLNLKKLFN